MTTEELLTIMRREVLALDLALKEKNDE